MRWEPVIGLEVHIQLLTQSKIFSGESTRYGAEPNMQACAVDIALPGVLPVMNKEAVRMAVKFGLAVGAQINHRSVFARKNYFYPDLPKGYQISQYELPIVSRGHIDIEYDGAIKTIDITRAHLEEDAGKSLHEDFHGLTGIDLNRAGTPLLEIVSEPDMRSAQEAVSYLKKLHALVRYLQICDGNMQEGSFRCDANVSVRPRGQTELGTRSELKNINSFRFVEKAIEFEIERQIDVLEGGGTVVQETRLYDPGKDETRSMRSKEEAHDYRYFPDPDLPPLEFDETFVEAVKQTLPELPDAKRDRFLSQYGLNAYDAGVLTTAREMADYYEEVVSASGADPKLVANWVTGELSGYLNKDNREIAESAVSSTALAGLIKRIADSTISGKIAKEVLDAMWNGEGDADAVIEKRGLKQITDMSAIEKVVDEVLAANPVQVEQHASGEQKVFGYFVGQVMKATSGKANPKQVNEILEKKLRS
ncbi:MAG: Asp-tRNA(Asn)/Glu-tRNA(Gln) amidotransferase subunit GatB [Acidiferrobacterales bacterium]|nr:Asp-tRNA(Asn)/Glu-tRNA(Gln) amidotransferase subunit GatB [Gammaproteobacteria bacterium]